jgi:hypothetical protein
MTEADTPAGVHSGKNLTSLPPLSGSSQNHEGTTSPCHVSLRNPRIR